MNKGILLGIAANLLTIGGLYGSYETFLFNALLGFALTFAFGAVLFLVLRKGLDMTMDTPPPQADAMGRRKD